MQTSEKIVNNSTTTLTLFQPKIRRKSPIEINSPVHDDYQSTSSKQKKKK